MSAPNLLELAFLFCLTPISLNGLDIRVAPIFYDDESGIGGNTDKSPELDLVERLNAARLGDAVSIECLPRRSRAGGIAATLDGKVEPPGNIFDAALLCQTLGCSSLFYGYVKRTSYSYYAEIKAIAQEDKKVSAVFIGGDDSRHYDRLIDDLAAKIIRYIRGDLGIGPPTPREIPARNVLSVSSSAGYWAPLGNDWSSALAGLAAASLGLRFAPELPLFSLWAKTCYMAFGIDLEYLYGTNRPGLESFSLHVGRLRLPVEASMELGRGHLIGLGLGAFLDIDTMNQAHEYGATTTQVGVVSGASIEIIYRYALSEVLSLGLCTFVDASFYTLPMFAFSPRLSLDLRL
jgi:hypothetical protein